MDPEYSPIVINGETSSLDFVDALFSDEEAFILARSGRIEKFLCVGDWQVGGPFLPAAAWKPLAGPTVLRPRSENRLVLSFKKTNAPKKAYSGLFNLVQIGCGYGLYVSGDPRIVGDSKFDALKSYVDEYNGPLECAYLFEGVFNTMDADPLPERWDVME
jgi:hypothetical protein